jgi:hypothetical protein
MAPHFGFLLKMTGQKMHNLRANRALALISGVILAVPVPSAQGKTILIPMSMCNSSAQKLTVPVDPSQQDTHHCCRKACHAASDRRKKAGALFQQDCC